MASRYDIALKKPLLKLSELDYRPPGSAERDGFSHEDWKDLRKAERESQEKAQLWVQTYRKLRWEYNRKKYGEESAYNTELTYYNQAQGTDRNAEYTQSLWSNK